ncbi:hypothetical protein C7212DRAFT_346238 [Tuber magnatum]|uniref:Uncharacterized protein n=1 Tax=Tuber magnatum TaxID=42249 RepID=A0A317SMR0_9PEZI|nr:hypothetical protein C7212DRAFT_346238 [Tuber magnatum]
MSNMSTYTTHDAQSTAPVQETAPYTRAPQSQPPYVCPLNLTDGQYGSLRELIKSRLTPESPGLLGAGPEHLNTFNTWFTEFLEQEIVPAFFSNEEGVYWGRSREMISADTRRRRRDTGVMEEHLGSFGGTSDQPTTAAPVMETVNPCCVLDTANLQVQEDDFYPEENALSPEEYYNSLGGFEEYIANGGGGAEGYFGMPDGESAMECFRDGGLESSDVVMEGGEYAYGGSGETPFFAFGVEGGVFGWVGVSLFFDRE